MTPDLLSENDSFAFEPLEVARRDERLAILTGSWLRSMPPRIVRLLDLCRLAVHR